MLEISSKTSRFEFKTKEDISPCIIFENLDKWFEFYLQTLKKSKDRKEEALLLISIFKNISLAEILKDVLKIDVSSDKNFTPDELAIFLEHLKIFLDEYIHQHPDITLHRLRHGGCPWDIAGSRLFHEKNLTVSHIFTLLNFFDYLKNLLLIEIKSDIELEAESFAELNMVKMLFIKAMTELISVSTLSDSDKKLYLHNFFNLMESNTSLSALNALNEDIENSSPEGQSIDALLHHIGQIYKKHFPVLWHTQLTKEKVALVVLGTEEKKYIFTVSIDNFYAVATYSILKGLV